MTDEELQKPEFFLIRFYELSFIRLSVIWGRNSGVFKEDRWSNVEEKLCGEDERIKVEDIKTEDISKFKEMVKRQGNTVEVLFSIKEILKNKIKWENYNS